MVKYSDAQLNRVFSALADPTRRAVLASLANGVSPVGELARPFGMSLPGFMKHLGILEDAGLLKRDKTGRVVNCELAAQPLRDAAEWLAHYQVFWEERLDALADYLEKEKQSWNQSRKSPPSNSSATSTPRRKTSGTRLRNRKR